MVSMCYFSMVILARASGCVVVNIVIAKCCLRLHTHIVLFISGMVYYRFDSSDLYKLEVPLINIETPISR